MGLTRFVCLALSAALSVAAVSCADNDSDDGGAVDPSTTSSTGGSGAEGGAGSGGAGGGGGVYTGPCDQDCSKITAPTCYESVCNEGQYPGTLNTCTVVVTAGASCDDGLFCTVNETCTEEGMCVGGGQNNCGMLPGQCANVGCDEASKTCIPTPAADGEPCVDDDLCTVNGKCQNAACVGTPKDCNATPEAACNTMACNPDNGNCEPTPDAAKNGASCTFGELCNDGTTCDNGACTGGAPKDCTGLSVGCLNGVCNPNSGLCTTEPVAEGDACLDGNDECNVGMCDVNGLCQPVPTPGVSCPSAADLCNVGFCSAAGVCEAQAANDGAGCSDGNACTSGETCSAGVCQGGVIGGYELYFNETFASNSAGWTLGPEWGIGPAAASVGHTGQGPDPATDHTDTADNGVAGMVIGGNTSSAVVHPYQWLTSPVIDTSGAPGAVYLELWRWLNSDYTPYMENAIEVYNGTQWINIWTSGASPGVNDLAWTKIVHDITPYKNAQMQIRFGMSIGNVGAIWTVSSWNIDDVVVANQSCN